MQNNTTYTAGLYLRLSKDDEQAGESVSIGTQRAILLDFCQQEGYAIHDIYIDDGYSGLNFNRPGFQKMICHKKVINPQKAIEIICSNMRVIYMRIGPSKRG